MEPSIDEQVEELRIKVRPVIDEDLPFIYSSWLHSYRSGKAVHGVQNEIFYTGQHKLITSILEGCNVVVLCNEQDLGHIYGFGVAEEVQGVFTLHYLYIKHPYRGLGLAKILFKHLGGNESSAFCYTHRTKKAEQYDKKYSTAIYHPYLAFRHFVGDSHGSKEEVQHGKKLGKEKGQKEKRS